MSRRRAVVAGVAAAGLAAGSLVVTAAPAGASDLPCIEVGIDDEPLVEVCEYAVDTEPCPDGEPGVVVVVLGSRLYVCAEKIET